MGLIIVPVMVTTYEHINASRLIAREGACDKYSNEELAGIGTVAGFAVFLVFYLLGGMGGGDVKLMTAVGCLAGAGNIKNVLISTRN